MSSQRIKGQEVALQVFVDNKLQTSLTDIRSFEVTFQTEVLKEGYLGETTNRRDEVFNGCAGKFDLHFEDDTIFDFVLSVVNRARRRTPGVKINIRATLNFPGGARPRVLFQDCSFGELPMNFASRHDYGQVSVNFESSDFNKI